MFDKYETMGAYHWRECSPSSREYNPPLVARYGMIARRVQAGRVLDVGAGDGYLSHLVADACDSVVALECEPAGIEIARTMLADRPNVEVVEGSAYEIPFAAASFDAVMMADVIEHLHEPAQAAQELARVTAADGAAYVTTPQWRPDRRWDERHVKEFRPEELRELLQGAFTEVEMHFAWPRLWSDLYRTRLGWRALKWAGRLGFNPFARESRRPQRHGQMLAVCRLPRGRSAGA